MGEMKNVEVDIRLSALPTPWWAANAYPYPRNEALPLFARNMNFPIRGGVEEAVMR